MAIGFIRAAMETGRLQGLNVEEALCQAGIAPELTVRDAARVTRAQATRLIQVLWDATEDELLGVGPKPVPRGMFRMMTLGVIHAPDLRTALRRLVEFTRISLGFEAVEFFEDDEIVRLSFDPGGRSQADQLVIDVIMAVVHRFAGWLIGQQIVLNSVDLPGAAPQHAADYLLIYGVAPTFDAAGAAITFDRRYLSVPTIRGEDELAEFIRSSPDDLLFRQDYNPTTASRVCKIIERTRGDDAVTTDDVATRLNVSTQHLRRLLRDEGTSFREIKEDVLRDQAIAALVGGRETVEELSDRLGFSEPSAFRRAFRRWTGSPPGSYRPS